MGLAIDDAIFDVGSYKLNIPTLDDLKATKLDVRFSGSGSPTPRLAPDGTAVRHGQHGEGRRP